MIIQSRQGSFALGINSRVMVHIKYHFPLQNELGMKNIYFHICLVLSIVGPINKFSIVFVVLYFRPNSMDYLKHFQLYLG